MNSEKFFPMTEIPPRSEDKFSVIVTVYEDTGDYGVYHDLGWYDFESSEWVISGNDSMNLVCWTLIPDAQEFIKNNDLPITKHRGYRP